MVVSDDIDTQMLTGVEFYFKYGCNDKDTDWPRAQSVLFQYSTNGGIIWNLIKEIHYSDTSKVRFVSFNEKNMSLILRVFSSAFVYIRKYTKKNKYFFFRIKRNAY